VIKKIGLCLGIVVFALVFSLDRYLTAQPLPQEPLLAPPVLQSQQMVVADLDNDKKKEIIVLNAGRITVFDHKGKQEFEAFLPKQ